MSRGCKARSRVRKGTSVRLGVPFPSPLALVGLPPPRWCACSRWRAWPPGPPPARVRRPSPTRWSHWASVMCECGDTWPGGDSPSSVPDLTRWGGRLLLTDLFPSLVLALLSPHPPQLAVGILGYFCVTGKSHSDPSPQPAGFLG